MPRMPKQFTIQSLLSATAVSAFLFWWFRPPPVIHLNATGNASYTIGSQVYDSADVSVALEEQLASRKRWNATPRVEILIGRGLSHEDIAKALDQAFIAGADDIHVWTAEHLSENQSEFERNASRDE